MVTVHHAVLKEMMEDDGDSIAKEIAGFRFCTL